jgi:hypothetical protein
MKARRQAPAEANWGDLWPARRCEWIDVGEDVCLLVPRLGRSRLARKLERRLRLSPYRVHLDAFGSFVWRRCDGSATVREIARGLREAFGESIEPAEDRLVAFLTRLIRGRFLVVSADRPPRHPSDATAAPRSP